MISRINKIKEIIRNSGCDSYIVTNNSDIRYFSDLKSSNIALLITLEKSYVFSDSRYKFLIERQKNFIPCVVKKTVIEALIDKITELNLKNTLIDPTHINHLNYSYLSEKIQLTNKTNITKELRIIKSDNEISSIIEAQKIAEKAFLNVIKNIKEGDTTKEIAAKLDYKMSLYGSEEPAFSSIVVNGEESADCHGVPSDKMVKKGDIILFDFGATFNGYRSDMTRTVFVGEISDDKRKIYDIVYNAHIKASSALKPGVKCNKIDEIARNYIEDHGYGEEFLHSLGHGVGIDIHESPTLSKKCEEILKEGMVVTIEPGIYLENKFGIRIEDTYIITKCGAKSIANIEKTIIII